MMRKKDDVASLCKIVDDAVAAPGLLKCYKKMAKLVITFEMGEINAVAAESLFSYLESSWCQQ